MSDLGSHPSKNLAQRHMTVQANAGWKGVTNGAVTVFGTGNCTQLIVCVQYTAAVGTTVISLLPDDNTVTANKGIFLTEGTHILDIDVQENVFVTEVTVAGVNVGIAGLK